MHDVGRQVAIRDLGHEFLNIHRPNQRERTRTPKLRKLQGDALVGKPRGERISLAHEPCAVALKQAGVALFAIHRPSGR
jgi:hypothetical protein